MQQLAREPQENMIPDVDDSTAYAGGQIPIRNGNSKKDLCETEEHSSQITIYTTPISVSNFA